MYEVHQRSFNVTTVVRRTHDFRDALLFFNECHRGEVKIFDLWVRSYILKVDRRTLAQRAFDYFFE